MQTTVHQSGLSSGAGHFRRYHGYDYSRGAALLLSFNVEPEEDILGSIVAPGVLVHNEWGRLVDDVADGYIDNNPRKRWLLMSPDHPMRVEEPLEGERLPSGNWWAGVGALELLGRGERLASFRLSRSLPEAWYDTVIACALRAVAAGYAIASTFISPCERRLFDALVACPKARIVKAGHKILGCVYKPVGDEPRLFAEGRYLLLSRQANPVDSRRQGWLDINADIAVMADRAVYARVGEGGRLAW